MNNQDETISIIQELYDEFDKEAVKLQVKYDNNVSKLDELDVQIHSLAKSDDYDIKVFSPRRHISTDTNKVANLKSEREALVKTNNEVEHGLRYYSKRADKLKALMDLLECNAGIFRDTSEVKLSEDPTISEVEPREDIVYTPHQEDLLKIQQRLDSIYYFIDSDSNRAKLEIKDLLILIGEMINI